MNTRSVNLILALAALLVSAGTSSGTETPSDSEITFEKWAFKLSLPTNAQRQPAQPAAREGLREVYVADGLAYVVKIISTPPNSLTSTAIEQAIQADMKSGAQFGEVRRWELYTRGGELFKGLSRISPVEGSALGAVEYAAELFGGDRVFQSVSMAPLGDESSPILSLGVVGPADKESDIENQAKFIAFSVGKVEKPRPAVAGKPAAPPSDRRPPTATPRALKKGDIELFGTVASVADDRNSLVLTVTRIRMPGGEPVKLDPPRSKRVLVKKLAENVRTGTSILVIGRNDGVGMPILADTLEVQEQAGASNAEKR